MTMQLHLQQVPARNGRLWIRHGFKVFQRQPLALVGLFGLFFFVAMTALLLLPGLGFFLFFGSLPLLSLGFMLATHLVLQKKAPNAGVFIAPLKLTAERRRHQLMLCGGYVLSVLLIVLLGEWVDGGAARDFAAKMTAGDSNGVADSLADPRLFWGITVRTLLMMLLTVPYWHAPALVHWGGQGAAQALFSSALALWRNRAAFVVNGLLWAFIMIATSLVPAMLLSALGLMVLAPFVGTVVSLVVSTVFYASLYFTFVDCFMFGAPQNLLDDKQG